MSYDDDQPSVLQSIENMALSFEMNYMRHGISISLEPDAFYRLMLELKGGEARDPVSQEMFSKTEFTVNTSAGPISIKKDASLGTSSYTKVWIE